MADQPEKKTKRNRRSTRKKPASKIGEAQQAAVQARKERDSLRAQSAAQAAQLAVSKTSPNQPFPAQPGVAGKAFPGDPKYSKTPDRTKTSGPGDSKAITDPLLAGLSTGIGVNNPGVAKQVSETKRELANTDLYGKSAASRESTLRNQKVAIDDTRRRLLSKNDNAVYMGPGKVKYRNAGPQRIDPETGASTSTIEAGDDIQSKDELMSWLADPQKVEEIKKAANQAGLNVESYDDISKLWESVVSMAASTYSRTAKKVTPWALIAMRGKYAGPDGKMQDKVTTSTQIDEMDPAEARGLFEQTATNLLGRSPSQAELDDFIAKAQMIARDNPAISTTRTKVGFDGNVEQGTSQTVTKGGSQVVNAKAQMAAQDMAKQSEDYGAFQAAGTYFPLLFDALSSPV